MSELSNLMRAIANRPARAPVHTVVPPRSVYTRLLEGARHLGPGRVEMYHRTLGTNGGNFRPEGYEVRVYLGGDPSPYGRDFADKLDAHDYYLRVTGANVAVTEISE